MEPVQENRCSSLIQRVKRLEEINKQQSSLINELKDSINHIHSDMEDIDKEMINYTIEFKNSFQSLLNKNQKDIDARFGKQLLENKYIFKKFKDLENEYENLVLKYDGHSQKLENELC